MKTIYILNAYIPVSDEKPDGTETYATDGYDVRVQSEQIGAFSSVEAAEKAIKNTIASRKRNDDWYSDWTDYCAFVLSEHELDAGLDEYGNPPGYESVRSYLGNGELNCFSDYDDRCRKPFVGRDDTSEYVEEGGYALYLRGDRLVPILVDRLAPTKAEWKERFAEGVEGDVTDDSGLAYVAGYGHDHPFSPYVFPLSVLRRYEMPETLAGELLREKEAYGTDGEARPDMKCYAVTCEDAGSNSYEVGVMASDAERAAKAAEKSLFEGRRVTAKAVGVRETAGI